MKTQSPTRPGIVSFRFPVWIREIIYECLQRLNRLVLVHERVTALAVSHEARYDATDRIRTSPQVLSYWVSDLIEKNAGWVDEAQTSDDGYILRDDVFRICTRVEEAFLIPVGC